MPVSQCPIVRSLNLKTNGRKKERMFEEFGFQTSLNVPSVSDYTYFQKRPEIFLPVLKSVTRVGFEYSTSCLELFFCSAF